MRGQAHRRRATTIPEDTAAAVIGARIRQERQSRRPPMTLAELAGGEVSISLVSRIERGEVTPSLRTLRYLARRLDRPLASLLPDEAAETPDHLWSQALGAASAHLLGDSRAALTAAAAVLDDEAAPPEARAVALVVRTAALLDLQRGHEALAAAIAAVQQAMASGAPGLVATAAWLALGDARAAAGEIARAEEAWARAADLAGPSAAAMLLRPLALLRLAQAAAEGGVTETGESLLQQAADPVAQAADPAIAAHALLDAARQAAAAGNGRAALTWAAGSLALAGWLATAPLVATIGAWRARLALTAGRWRESLARLAEAVEHQPAGSTADRLPLIGQVAADIVRDLHRRHTGQPASGGEEGAPIASAAGDPLAVARAHHAAGDLEGFTRLALAALDGQRCRDTGAAVTVLLEVGEAWAAAGATGRALAYFRRAAALATDH